MPIPQIGQRGPAEHERREQIIAAAYEHFCHYGYTKTTVADLAKMIGLSTSYIYKFFDSKKAIGEAVCTRCLAEISDAVRAISEDQIPASDRLRRVFLEVGRQGAQLFFRNRRIYDIVVVSFEERWGAGPRHNATLLSIVRRIVQDGRDAGLFERKTPLDETCRAIMLAMEPVRNPILLEQQLDAPEEDAALLANMVLRSLSF